jgi:hypothetical protein
VSASKIAARLGGARPSGGSSGAADAVHGYHGTRCWRFATKNCLSLSKHPARRCRHVRSSLLSSGTTSLVCERREWP